MINDCNNQHVDVFFFCDNKRLSIQIVRTKKGNCPRPLQNRVLFTRVTKCVEPVKGICA